MEEIHFCTSDVDSKKMPSHLKASCGVTVENPAIFPWQAHKGSCYCQKCLGEFKSLSPRNSIRLIATAAEAVFIRP